MTSCHTSLADVAIRHSKPRCCSASGRRAGHGLGLEKVLWLEQKMASSHATKWHQCKEGCLGCSCGNWCWTAVLANLTIDWTHIKLSTVNQQTPFDIQIIPNLMPLARNSFQQIYYRLSLYMPSLAVACFHKICDARKVFPKNLQPEQLFTPLSTIFDAMKHSWRVVQWLRTRPHPKCHGRPMTKRVLRQRQMQYRNNQTGTVVNLILTPNQPVVSHTKAETT